MWKIISKITSPDGIGDDRNVGSSGGQPGGGGGASGPSSSLQCYLGKQFRLNRFTLVVDEVIAEGGFGIVFKVRNVASNPPQIFALKRMYVNNEHDLNVCKREITIVSSLTHKNILRYIDSSISEPQKDIYEILLLSAYCPGTVVQLMNERLRLGQRLSEDEVMRIITDVCEAVSRLHHCVTPILHRDLKVENILIDERGHYVLCDFGSATSRVLHPPTHGVHRCEEEILRYTTLSYRSPEMVDLYSGHSIGTPADIWALGVLLFRLVYFTLPFGESSLAIQSGNFTLPANIYTIYSHKVNRLIQYMLQVEPENRPDIFQVSSLAFQMLNRPCPVQNINKKSVPSWDSLPLPCVEGEVRKSSLPAPKERAASNTTSQSQNRLEIPDTVQCNMTKADSVSGQHRSRSPGVSADLHPGSGNPVRRSPSLSAGVVTTTSVVPRQRPRPGGSPAPPTLINPATAAGTTSNEGPIARSRPRPNYSQQNQTTTSATSAWNNSSPNVPQVPVQQPVTQILPVQQESPHHNRPAPSNETELEAWLEAAQPPQSAEGDLLSFAPVKAALPPEVSASMAFAYGQHHRGASDGGSWSLPPGVYPPAYVAYPGDLYGWRGQMQLPISTGGYPGNMAIYSGPNVLNVPNQPTDTGTYRATHRRMQSDTSTLGQAARTTGASSLTNSNNMSAMKSNRPVSNSSGASRSRSSDLLSSSEAHHPVRVQHPQIQQVTSHHTTLPTEDSMEDALFGQEFDRIRGTADVPPSRSTTEVSAGRATKMTTSGNARMKRTKLPTGHPGTDI